MATQEERRKREREKRKKLEEKTGQPSQITPINRPRPKPRVTQVRPTGTPVSRNVDPATLTSEARAEIGREGRVREEMEKEKEGIAVEATRRRLQGDPTIEEERAALEEKGAFEVQVPQRSELDIERTGTLETAPGGASLVAAKRVAFDSSVLGILMKNELFGFKPNKDVEPLIQDPQTAREIVLQQIQIEEIKKGTSGAEKFGAIIEAIPAVGPKVGSYMGSLETPASNVNTVLKEIKEMRGTILKEYESIRSGLLKPLPGYDLILEHEETIFRLETRIQLLSLESAELIADADMLNLVESRILRAKETAFYAKEAAKMQITGEVGDGTIAAWMATELASINQEEV